MAAEEKKYVLDVISDGQTTRVIYPEAKVVGASPQKKFEGTIGALNEEESTTNLWANWGEDNKLPTTIREKIEAVPMASAAIAKLTSMMYGNGLVYYRNSDLRNGNTKVKRAYIPEVETFLRKLFSV